MLPLQILRIILEFFVFLFFLSKIKNFLLLRKTYKIGYYCFNL